MVQNSDHTGFFTLIMLEETAVTLLCMGILVIFLAHPCLRAINTYVKDHFTVKILFAVNRSLINLLSLISLMAIMTILH